MKNGLLKKIIVVVAVGTIAISMVGCGKTKTDSTKGDANASGIEAIKSKGKLVVGTSADYPPYEFHKEIDGKDQIVGFDMDIAKQIATDLGVELEIKDMDFDGLLIALQANKVDMVFAGMTPTAERKENADFSDIYYTAQHGFMMRSGEESGISSMNDLKGKKIGVQKGSIQEGIAQNNFDAANIKSLPKVTDLVLDLKNNKVDAVLAELPVAKINCEKNQGIALTSVVVDDPDGGSAIAMKKGSTELQTAVNKTIKSLKDQNKIDDLVLEANKLVD